MPVAAVTLLLPAADYCYGLWHIHVDPPIEVYARTWEFQLFVFGVFRLPLYLGAYALVFIGLAWWKARRRHLHLDSEKH